MKLEILTLVLLNVCHFLGDYTHLSTKWMLKAKGQGTPVFPILCHGLIHAVLMSTVLYFLYGYQAAIVGGIVQLTTHTLIDIWKGKMNVWFPSVSNPTNKMHWYLFGIDQTLHQIVIISMMYISLQF